MLEWVNDFSMSGIDSSFYLSDHSVDVNGNYIIIGEFSGGIDFDLGPDEAIFSTSSLNEKDFFVTKYNNVGEYMWCFTIKNQNGKTRFVEVDDDGNIYITGTFRSTIDFDPSTNTNEISPLAQSDVFIAKYNSNGEFVWVKGIPCTGNTVVDHLELNNVQETFYITGYFWETIDFDPGIGTDEYTAQSSDNYDTYIAKYDFSGNYEWAHQIVKGGIGSGYYPKLAVDEVTDDVYLTGHFVDTVQFDNDSIAPETIAYGTSNDNNRDVFIIKYNSQGGFQWVNRLYGDENQEVRGFEFSNGSLFCAGGAVEEVYFSNSSSNINIASNIYAANPILIKIDSDGNLTSSVEIKGVDGWGSAIDLSLINDSTLYTVGVFRRTMDFSTDFGTYQVFADSSDGRIYIAKYDEDLNVQNVNVLKGTGSTHHAFGIASTDGSNSFSIVGNFLTSINLSTSQSNDYVLENQGERKWFLAKYKESSLTLSEESFYEGEINLYPNPTSEVHTLKLNGFENDNICIEMYDIQGRKLNTIHDDIVDDIQTFEVNVSHLHAGIYFYKIVSKDLRKTIQFIKQ